MFKLVENPTFTHTVKVKVPVDGGYADQSFKATFNVVPLDERRQFDLEDAEASDAFLRRIIAKLDDIADAEGKPLEYSDAVRDALIARDYVRIAIVRSYFEAMGGARSGN